MHNKQTILCPDCQGEIIIADDAAKGEVVSCADCSGDFEITNVQPLAIEHAPEVQEDWGQ